MKSIGQETSFVQVTDTETLEALFARSQDKPVILFKHSLTCPISRTAYEEMSQLATEIAIIVVQRARDISREVAARTGIRHESPQAIVLRNGRAVWSASHWDVTSHAVESAVQAYM